MLDDGSIAATRDRWTTSIRRSRTERTGAAEAAVLSRWIVVVLACLGYSRSELRVGGENIRVRKRKRSYQFHQRWGASFFLFYSAICALGLKLQICLVRVSKQNPKKNRRGMQITWQLTMSVRPTFADGGHLKWRVRSEAKQHDNPGAQRSHSIPHLHVWSQRFLQSG
jgi:hypothetical protein